MSTNRFIYSSVKYFTSAAIVSGCLFVSSAHAVFIAEAHACEGGSEIGGPWLGGYYYPASRSAVTLQRFQRFPQQVHLTVELWAYPEDGSDSIVAKRHVVSQPGVLRNQAVAIVANSQTAPGRVLSVNAAWTPTMTRFGGVEAGLTAPLGKNGCKNSISFF